MSDTHVVTASFPTLDAARSARGRLARAGFARNSVDIERQGDAFEVNISTRNENRRRVERILEGRSVAQSAGQAGGAARDFVYRHPVASAGLAALAGFVLFGLANRR